jgi:phage baseplate assembly protein W
MATTINITNTHFVDLDLSFQVNPITRDVAKKLDDKAIKQSLISLVMTKPYETPFHPEISSQANAVLFDLDTPITKEIIRTTVIQVITKFEPRVQLIDVTVNSVTRGYNITIDFYIIGSTTPYTVQTMLTRTR